MKKSRVDLKDRIAVNAVERVFLKELNWIFREQPIVDVGIDVLVEESIDGNPLGKFLAVQVKGGNYEESKKNRTLTYYLSEVHYLYWTNLDLPIILVLYDEQTDALHWMEVSESTISKTPKGRKIVVPKAQILSKKEQPKLRKIIHKFRPNHGFWNPDLALSPGGLYEYIDSMVKIRYLSDSIGYQNKIFTDLQNHINERNIAFKILVDKGLRIGNPEVDARVHGFASLLNINATRLLNETLLFAKLAVDTILAYKFVLSQNYIQNGFSQLDTTIENIKNIENLIGAFDIALEPMRKINLDVVDLPEAFPLLKIARDNFSIAITSIIANIEDARNMWVSLSEELKALTNTPYG